MGDSIFMTASQIAQDARRSRTVKDEAQPTAPLLEETFAHSFASLGAQLVAIRQQGEKRYKKSPAHKQERKAARASNRKPSKRVSYTDEEEAALQVIEVRAKELRQVERIVSADPELMNLVEASIGVQVRDSTAPPNPHFNCCGRRGCDRRLALIGLGICDRARATPRTLVWRRHAQQSYVSPNLGTMVG